MKLEEELKQRKGFSNEYERLVVNILFTASWLEGKNIQRLKPYGISPQQYNVLRILKGASPEPITLNVIAQRMIDKNSNATRLVEKLRLKGLVKRQVCPTNRRQVDITITEKGMELLDVINQQAEEWYNQFKTLSLKDTRQLNELLDSLRG